TRESKESADFREACGSVWESRKRRSEEHTSELQSPCNLVCRLLLEKKKKHNQECLFLLLHEHIAVICIVSIDLLAYEWHGLCSTTEFPMFRALLSLSWTYLLISLNN